MTDPQMHPEPTAVQLTRIEGTLNLVAFQVKDVVGRMDRAEGAIGSLTANVQTLTQARVTDTETRILTAQAVKDAKDIDDDRANKKYSPFQKTAVAIAATVNFLVLWQYVIPHK